MTDPNNPTEQPKHVVDDALVDRNSDPAAQAADSPAQREGDAPMDASGSRQREQRDPTEHGETF
jgi:hypothetical protein